MAAPGYITVADLKVALNDDRPVSKFDALYEQAINSASRQIDQYCGDQFYLDPAPSARLFRPADRQVLWTKAFASPIGVVVEVDTNDTGTFDTVWTAADWAPEPLTPRPGRPFDRISALGVKYWPVAFARNSFYGYGYGGYGAYGPGYSGYGDGSRNWASRRPRVRVTATWGWPEVPIQVVQACQIVATDLFKAKDLTSEQPGLVDVAATRYMTRVFAASHVPGFSPQAFSLLSGLRDPVLA